MSSLKPTGVPLPVDGVERHILFTLNAIDSIQSDFDLSMEEVITELTIPKNATKAFRKVIKHLLDDEVEREKHWGENKDLKKYTEEEIGWLFDQENIPDTVLAIFKAYGLSLPESEEESPNQESVQQNS